MNNYKRVSIVFSRGFSSLSEQTPKKKNDFRFKPRKTVSIFRQKKRFSFSCRKNGLDFWPRKTISILKNAFHFQPQETISIFASKKRFPFFAYKKRVGFLLIKNGYHIMQHRHIHIAILNKRLAVGSVTS